MFSGEPPPELSRTSLKKSSREALLRLARWEGLRYGLDEMSDRQLVRLIQWKLRKRRIRYD